MRYYLAVALGLLVVLGCGGSKYEGLDGEVSSPMTRAKDDSTSALPVAEGDVAGGFLVALDPDDVPRAVAKPQQQKIIYTASVVLVVDDLKATTQSIMTLVDGTGGYIHQFLENSTQGAYRRGHWVVRVPVERFDTFLEELVDLGVPETQQRDAQDVTEEFVDLESRLSNQRRLEKRILDLLEKQTSKLSDVIDVETKLAAVREQIERIEGRLRYLKNKTRLTTITIDAREEKDYEPPQAPTFDNQISSSWHGSIDALRKFGRGLAIVSVGAAPWLGVLAMIFLPVVIVLRRSIRRSHAARSPAVPPRRAAGP